MIGVTVTGMDAVARYLQKASDEIVDAAAEVVAETAAELQGNIVLRMQQGPHTGRTYRRSGVVHQTSGPGQAPAPDTGALIGSIYSEQEGRLNWVVGSRMVYAAYLEYGTRRMAARPAWEPEALKMQRTFTKNLVQAIKGATK